MHREAFCEITSTVYDPDCDEYKEHLEQCNDCKHKENNPQEHALGDTGAEVATEKTDEQTSLKIYKFAKNKIKKFIVSDIDLNQVFGFIETNNHIETIDISSSKAKTWLRYSYFKEYGENHSDESYVNALRLLKAEAIYENSPRQTIYNRIAMVEDQIYYDLVTPDWKIVKISHDSVEVLSYDENMPVFFRKQTQNEQIMPKFGEKDALDLLVALLRIPRKDQMAFKVHLIAMLLESYPIPIMSIIGEHGSIKTTICRTIKTIIDAASAATVSLSGKHDDLVLSLSNRYLVCFDNVSKIDQDTSDILCKAITGDGNSKRKLYTDSDEIIFKYKRKIILNGISPNMEYPDLSDRNITYVTNPIPEEERITEEEFNNTFAGLLPYVLGQIFSVLSKTLSLHNIVKSELKHLPRMADFAVWGESIARVLGYEPFAFLENYKQRIILQSINIVEEYPIIHIIEDMLKDQQGHYEDTVQSFLAAAEKRAEIDGIDIKSKHIEFPGASNKVRGHIQRLKPNLRALGIEVDILQYKKNDGKHPKNRQVIYIDEKKNTISHFGEE